MPGDNLRQIGEGSATFQNRSVPGSSRQQMKSSNWCLDNIQGVFQERKRVDLEVNQASNIIEGIPKDKAGALKGSVKVSEQRELAVERVGKKQRRPASLIHTALHRPDLEPRVKRSSYFKQHPTLFQVSNTFLKIAVSHQPLT